MACSSHRHDARSDPVIRAVAVGLTAVTVVVFVAFIAVFAVHRLTPVDGAKRFVDIGAEANLPSWWNTSLLVIVSVLAVVASLRPFEAGERPAARAWWIVAAATAYLGLDEAAGLHERLAGPVESSDLDLPTYAWLVPGVLLAAVGCAVLVVAARQLPPRVARGLGFALATYAIGAVGFEAVTGLVTSEPGDDSLNPAFTIGIIIEEGLEMAACVMAACSIAAEIRREDPLTSDTSGAAEMARRRPPTSTPNARS